MVMKNGIKVRINQTTTEIAKKGLLIVILFQWGNLRHITTTDGTSKILALQSAGSRIKRESHLMKLRQSQCRLSSIEAAVNNRVCGSKNPVGISDRFVPVNAELSKVRTNLLRLSDRQSHDNSSLDRSGRNIMVEVYSIFLLLGQNRHGT
jgi:hypothetical protein